MLLNCGVGEDSWDCEESWTARRYNQSIIMEISPGCSLEGLMLKLKLQYFGYLMWRVDSLEKTLMVGGIRGRRRRGRQRISGWMVSLNPRTWVWVNSMSWWWTGKPGVLWFMASQRVGHNWVTELTEGINDINFATWQVIRIYFISKLECVLLSLYLGLLTSGFQGRMWMISDSSVLSIPLILRKICTYLCLCFSQGLHSPS